MLGANNLVVLNVTQVVLTLKARRDHGEKLRLGTSYRVSMPEESLGQGIGERTAELPQGTQS